LKSRKYTWDLRRIEIYLAENNLRKCEFMALMGYKRTEYNNMFKRHKRINNTKRIWQVARILGVKPTEIVKEYKEDGN
jgi:hypothetical protein